MKIENTQYNIIKDNVIQTILKSGVIPTNDTIQKRIQEMLDGHIDNTPFFVPNNIKKNSTSSNIVYNKMYKQLVEDIKCLYSINFNDETINLIDNYNIQKEKIDNALSNIITTINNTINSDTLCNVIDFSNYYNIEFDGNNNKNIIPNTAFIDVKTKFIKNPMVLNKSRRNFIEDANININETSTVIYTNGELKNILTCFNSKYIQINEGVDTKETITILITFNEAIESNNIVFNFSSITEINIVPAISEDNINFVELNEEIGNEYVEWQFDTKNVKAIKLSITKNNPDGINGNKYRFEYIFNSIALYSNYYKKQSEFVTKPIEIDPFKYITVNADDRIYPTTSIKYFIGFDNDDENYKITWQPLNSNNEIATNVLSDKRIIANNSVVEYGNQIDDGYTILNIDNNTDLQTLKVLPGYQCWKVETFSERYSNGYIPQLSDYNIDNLINTSYIDCEEYNIAITAGTIMVLTQYVYCEEAKNLNNISFTFDSATAANISSNVFVNGVQMTNLNNNYTIHFKKGRNKICVMIYCHGNSIEDYNLYSFNSNLNTKKCSFEVYAVKPAKYIPYNVITRGIYKKNINYYSIKNNQIISRFNPLDITSKDGGMKFVIKYSYINKNTEEIMLNKKMKVRIMAILNSSTNTLTPSIKSLSIQTR